MMPDLMNRKHLIVSLGTGRRDPLLKPTSRVWILLRLLSQLTDCAAESHSAHEKNEVSAKSAHKYYFRLDPEPPHTQKIPVWLGNLPLDGWQDNILETLEAETLNYVKRVQAKLDEIVHTCVGG